MIEVQAHDRGLGIDKPDVQMALEHHQHTRHCRGIRLQGKRRESAAEPRNATSQRTPGRIGNDGASSLRPKYHSHLCLDPVTAVAIPRPKYTVPET